MAEEHEEGSVEILSSELLDVDLIHFNDWNPNEMEDEEFSALVQDIDEHGFDQPLEVFPHPDEKLAAEGAWMIVDGEHRLRAVKALRESGKIQRISVIKRDWDKVTAMKRTVRRNNMRGTHNESKMTSLIVRIHKKQEQQADKLARDMLIRDRTVVARAIESIKSKNDVTKLRSDDDSFGVDDGEASDEAKKAKEQSAKALAKQAASIMDELFSDAEETAELSFVVFTHRGQQQCVVQATPALVQRIEKAKKYALMESTDMNEIMAESLDAFFERYGV